MGVRVGEGGGLFTHKCVHKRVSFKHLQCPESSHIQSLPRALKILIPGLTPEILVLLVWRKAWTA